jgi:hypothetical protein
VFGKRPLTVWLKSKFERTVLSVSGVVVSIVEDRSYQYRNHAVQGFVLEVSWHDTEALSVAEVVEIAVGSVVVPLHAARTSAPTAIAKSDDFRPLPTLSAACPDQLHIGVTPSLAHHSPNHFPKRAGLLLRRSVLLGQNGAMRRVVGVMMMVGSLLLAACTQQAAMQNRGPHITIKKHRATTTVTTAPCRSTVPGENASTCPVAATVSLPSVIGMSAAQATATLEAAGLRATFIPAPGGRVDDESPVPGSKVAYGSAVELRSVACSCPTVAVPPSVAPPSTAIGGPPCSCPYIVRNDSA